MSIEYSNFGGTDYIVFLSLHSMKCDLFKRNAATQVWNQHINIHYTYTHEAHTRQFLWAVNKRVNCRSWVDFKQWGMPLVNRPSFSASRFPEPYFIPQRQNLSHLMPLYPASNWWFWLKWKLAYIASFLDVSSCLDTMREKLLICFFSYWSHQPETWTGPTPPLTISLV
jgi:hypothetical protein